MVAADHRSLVCASSHRFDIARQGYVSLTDGRPGQHLSDTAPMVAARRRVHASGFFDPVATAVAHAVQQTVTTDRPALVADVGAGTGHYLATALDRDDRLRGLGIDLSKYCARAVARCHPRAAALVADVWRPWPIRTGTVGAVLSVFSPRNIDEFARVLHPAGTLVVVTPRPDHLVEIVGPMGMLEVGADKDTRLRTATAAHFDLVDHTDVRVSRGLDAALVADVVAMGPSAFHRSAEDIRADADTLTAASGGHLDVTVSVGVSIFRPRVTAEPAVDGISAPT
ncbi:rRNA methyltransferase [Gordonia sp. ABSL11-1]|nr:rRNA methyltransferase [Gordonia sp. ABSL11-1]MDL9944030.1 rRNA methyltransferase [Gordonia sp. ABSL11-1]